nr:Cache 3/Cache 2 fusion domain-containing protein [Candidatus Dependentiae bacterium]
MNLKKFMPKTLKSKLLLLIIAITVIPLLLTGIVTYSNTKKTVDDLLINDLAHISTNVRSMCVAQKGLLQEFIESDYKVANSIFLKYQVSLDQLNKIRWSAVNQLTKDKKDIELPSFKLGEEEILQNSDPDKYQKIVDDVKKLTGATCTIFQRMNESGDMLRISTSVLNKEGKRALGTYIPYVNDAGEKNKVIETVLKGEIYRGRAYVVDQWYITVYAPFKDSDGKVIGMLYVGRKEISVTSLIDSIKKIKIASTGYVFVLNSK